MTDNEWDESRYQECMAVLRDLETHLIERMRDADVATLPEGIKAIADALKEREV
jgi:hypothetical protein